MNDVELRQELEALRRGERDAFERIYRDMGTPVFTVILRITQDRAASEDILQEVFVKLFHAPPGPEVRKPRAYLLQTARNLAIDALRRQPRHEDIDAYRHLAREDPRGREERLDLERALGALSLPERQIVVLHVNGDLKFREIAEMLHVPLGTVLWRYRRAIGALRAMLSDGGTV